MSYLSIEFSVLFIVFLPVYWGLARYPNGQNWLLLFVSYAIVSSYSLQFALILFVYTCAVHFFACSIYHSKQHAKSWLVVALCIVTTNLAVFKYFDFFRYELQELLNFLHFPVLFSAFSILIPIGISFYTFHSVSYLVSVYKKELPLAKFLDLALFLSFFPSVIAGPINRADKFLPQITVTKPRQILQPHRAFTLIILSVIKVYCLGGLINDNWVGPIFSNPLEFSSLDLLFGLYGYAILIYFNFSGYTDLVTGIALLLGFELPKNFNSPYLAKNLRDFWGRWHISLSTWIRDYIYIPLGGSHKGFNRTQVNVMLAMVLSGLWHGSGINFMIWGACHGVGIIGLNILDKYFGRNAVSQYSLFAARVLTVHYVCFSWLFFHCENFSDTVDYLTAFTHNIFTENNYSLQLMGVCLLYIIYPKLEKIPEYFTILIKKISFVYLPFIFILLLYIAIYFAPLGVPNFIYASF